MYFIMIKHTDKVSTQRGKDEGTFEVPLYAGVAEMPTLKGSPKQYSHMMTVAGLYDSRTQAVEILYVFGDAWLSKALKRQKGQIKKAREFYTQNFRFRHFRQGSAVVPVVFNLQVVYNEKLKRLGKSIRIVSIDKTKEGYGARTVERSNEDLKTAEPISVRRIRKMRVIKDLANFLQSDKIFVPVSWLTKVDEGNGKTSLIETESPILGCAECIRVLDEDDEPVEEKTVIPRYHKRIEKPAPAPKKVQEPQPQYDPNVGEVEGRFGKLLDALVVH